MPYIALINFVEVSNAFLSLYSKENAIVTSLQFLTYKPDRQDTSKDLKNEIKKAIYSQYEAELSPLGDDVYVQDYT